MQCNLTSLEPPHSIPVIAFRRSQQQQYADDLSMPERKTGLASSESGRFARLVIERSGGSEMAKRYNIVTRCIAAIALVFIYFVGASAILVGTSTTSAQARGGGGFRGGGFRGGGFRGGGFRGGGR